MDGSRGRRGTGAAVARARAAALTFLAVTLAAAPVPASAAPSPASASASAAPARDPASVVVVDCSGGAQVRPGEYLIACGDGNNRLVGLDWKSWGTRTATATGTDLVNDCLPYCAAGKFRPYPVQVTLSRPAAWPARPGTHRYTSLRLVYPDTAPPPLPHDVTYKLVY
ncbi:hypothetical protein AB0953_23005 [Streptomyces sp. NPDC046866]|uniref:hypothetical protein n=1 Tax=Streptomyces sp. NPDC046866 TaxID=3154921 RepID=UPI003451CD25